MQMGIDQTIVIDIQINEIYQTMNCLHKSLVSILDDRDKNSETLKQISV
jgi:hypothetical protein